MVGRSFGGRVRSLALATFVIGLASPADAASRPASDGFCYGVLAVHLAHEETACSGEPGLADAAVRHCLDRLRRIAHERETNYYGALAGIDAAAEANASHRVLMAINRGKAAYRGCRAGYVEARAAESCDAVAACIAPTLASIP
jgi:hypothetical protein